MLGATAGSVGIEGYRATFWRATLAARQHDIPHRRTFSNQPFLALRYAVSLQNYKNYFNPSFNLGTTISIEHDNKRNAFSADWEPTFIFSPNAQGRLQTYRNDFLVFSYANTRPKRPDPNVGFNLDIAFSLGYLIGRQGDYFDKHTFRFCAGNIELARNKIRIQPCMYFYDFFRGVTPGVRITL